MPEFERIISKQNPLITRIRKLFSQRKYRREQGVFAAEGTKLFLDALNAGVNMETVICSYEAENILTQITGMKDVSGTRFVSIPPELYRYVSTQKHSQGIIFIAGFPPNNNIESVDIKGSIVLDGVQDPGNVGTIIRTAAAMGADTVILYGGCADPYGYKSARASMGAVFRICIYELYGVMELEKLLQINPEMSLCAAMPAYVGAISIHDVDWEVVIPVIGSEGSGVSEEILSICGTTFTIPMAGQIESLNAATAAGIILWEKSRHKR